MNPQISTTYTFARPRIRLWGRSSGQEDVRDDMGLGVGFVTKENINNRTCPVRRHSSWWYPLQRDIQGVVQCEFDTDFDTNLNGVYNVDQSKNQFRIFACNVTDEDNLKVRNDHIGGNWWILEKICGTKKMVTV